MTKMPNDSDIKLDQHCLYLQIGVTFSMTRGNEWTSIGIF